MSYRLIYINDLRDPCVRTKQFSHYVNGCLSFVFQEAEFLMYALYNKNKPKSDSLMSEYGTEFFRVSRTTLQEENCHWNLNLVFRQWQIC